MDLPSGRDGVFRPVATDVHTGCPIEVALLDGGGHAIKRTLPEAGVEQLKRDAALSRERYPRGYYVLALRVREYPEDKWGSDLVGFFAIRRKDGALFEFDTNDDTVRALREPSVW